ncbi:MAG: hypothetical protein HGB10_03975 [Coriobacteriia bacterium]|nr:hypothetical protein [Coriobacteriia bacterium]
MSPKVTQKITPTHPGLKRSRQVRTGVVTNTLWRQADGVQVHVFKIGETRENLPRMVSSLQSGETSSYVVGPYGKPSIALVSYERFRPLIVKGTKNERFAMLIADELLADAPQHLWTSAIEELSALPKSDLLTLWKLTVASSDDEVESLRGQMHHAEVLDRLLLRMRVANSIAEARDAGLYDAAESMTSTVFDSRR